MGKIFLNFFISVLCIIFLSGGASAQETDAKALLLSGKTDMDAGRYAEAIEKLSLAYEKMPAVGDYILFWISKSQREIGNIAESNAKIKELLKKYPETPLKKKARASEIRNILAAEETQTDLQAFEAYLKDYPDDFEIKYLFARLLNAQGRTERAKGIFKNIYINAEDILSRMARGELFTDDISSRDLLERAGILLNASDLQGAESLLREALLKDDGQNRHEILKKLARTLFSQRLYKDASKLYEEVGDQYAKTRSLYRSGDKTEFEDSLKKLISEGDQKAGALLIVVAMEKRRSNEYEEALRIYKKVKDNYPLDAENALWGIAWTYFRNNEYKKALAVFSELSDSYENPRYLYWKAQSLERLGRDAGGLYSKIAEKEQNFYSMLSKIKISKKNGNTANSSALYESNNKIEALSSRTLQMLASRFDLKLKPLAVERIDILLSLGMKREVISELSSLTRKTSDLGELNYLCLKMHDAGEFRLPILIAPRLSDREFAQNATYPVAHWEFVKEASLRHNVDPLVILSVMREESRFDQDARSSVGALGLMQLMPQTAYTVGKQINLNISSMWQIYDARTNILLGSFYINSLMKEFGSLPLAVAAYNAGSNAVKKWQKSGNYKSLEEFVEDIPYEETRNFTKRVTTSYFEYYKYINEKSVPRVF